MQKTIFTLMLIGSLCFSNAVFAASFETLDGITPAQLEQLTQIQQNFKKENDSLENRIMEYNNKLTKLKNDKDKTPQQIGLLSGAYERNLTTLKNQKKLLEQKTEADYRAIMTIDQYSQYKAEQINVQDAFKNFLQK